MTKKQTEQLTKLLRAAKTPIELTTYGLVTNDSGEPLEVAATTSKVFLGNVILPEKLANKVLQELVKDNEGK